MAEGNRQVILCERGIRSFDQLVTRNVADVGGIAVARMLTNLPIIIDPSHATGRRELVAPVALAGLAAGAAGVLVEMHPRPAEALCDGEQSLEPAELRQLADDCRSLWRVLRTKEALAKTG